MWPFAEAVLPQESRDLGDCRKLSQWKALDLVGFTPIDPKQAKPC